MNSRILWQWRVAEGAEGQQAFFAAVAHKIRACKESAPH
jgi:hypothetical protein